MGDESGSRATPDGRPDERLLVERTLQGDREAFRLLVLRYQGLVGDLVWRACGDRTVHEDLVQETFLRAYQKLGGFDPQRRLSTWLASIALNVARDHGRRRKVRDQGARHIAPAVNRGPGPLEAAEKGEVRTRVTAALDDLPEPQREVVVLSVWGGLSQREIAGALDVPLGTVKTRHRTALQRLRALVAPLVGGDQIGGPVREVGP